MLNNCGIGQLTSKTVSNFIRNLMRHTSILTFVRGSFHWGMCIAYYICTCISNAEIMLVCCRLFCWDIFVDNTYECWFTITLIVTEKGGGTRTLRAGVLPPWPSREGLFWTTVHRSLQCTGKYCQERAEIESN